MARESGPFWRAIGVETEFGVVIENPDGTSSFAPRYEDCPNSSCNFDNGDRRYLDVGKHPEGATGEVTTPLELMYAVEANYRLVRRHLVRGGANGVSKLYANNGPPGSCGPKLDDVTWSRHRNYMLLPDTDLLALHGFVEAYQISEILLLGSGHSTTDGRQSFLSPRAPHIVNLIGSQTTGNRPLHNTRDEPLAGGGYMRFHDTALGNAQILPRLTAVGAGAMLGVLALLETDCPEPPILSDPLESLHELNRNPAALLELESGELVTALEIQRWYFDRVYDLVVSAGDEAAHLLPWIIEWGELLDALGRSFDPADLVGKLDWATKRYMQLGWLERHPRPTSPNELIAWRKQYTALELSMHEISVEEDPPSTRERIIKGHLDESLVRAAMERNVSDATRARVRSWFVRALAHRGDHTIDWQNVNARIDGCPKRYFHLPDPLDPNPSPEMVEFVQSINPGYPLLDVL